MATPLRLTAESGAGTKASKQMCPNVIAPRAWPLAECRDHWDELVLRCHVTAEGARRLYQESRLAELTSAAAWIEVLERARSLRHSYRGEVLGAGHQ